MPQSIQRIYNKRARYEHGRVMRKREHLIVRSPLCICYAAFLNLFLDLLPETTQKSRTKIPTEIFIMYFLGIGV